MKERTRSTMFSNLILVFSFMIFASGCALQSSMVDLEDYTLRLRRHQRELQGRIEQLEREIKGPSRLVKKQQKLSAELISQLSDVEDNVREFTGRVDKSEHQMVILNNRLDAESFRSKELLKNFKQLQGKIVAFEQNMTKLSLKITPEKNIASQEGAQNPDAETTLSPTEAYNLAFNDYLQGNYDIAIVAFDAFIEGYPRSVLIPQALYWKAESYYSKKTYASAIGLFREVIQKFPRNEKASKALLKIGFSYLEQGDPDKGRLFLEKVRKDFPNSNEALLAKDKLVSIESSD